MSKYIWGFELKIKASVTKIIKEECYQVKFVFSELKYQVFSLILVRVIHKGILPSLLSELINIFCTRILFKIN